MSGSQRDNGQKDDHLMTYVTLGLMVLAIGAILWFFCRYYVLLGLLGPAWLQFKILMLLGINTAHAAKWVTWLGAVFDGRIKANTIGFNAIQLCLAYASYLSSVLFGIGFIGLITWSMFKSKPQGLHREFSLGGYVYSDVAWIADMRAPQWLGEALLIPMSKSRYFKWLGKALKVKVTKARVPNGTNFIAEMAREWRQVSCVIDFDPTDCIPQLSDGLSPEYWAAFNGVISKQAAYRLASRKPFENLGVIEWDVDKARLALAAQIEKGGEWKGVLKAPPIIQAVCLIAILNRETNNPAMTNLAGQCSDIARPLFALPAKAANGEIAKRRHEAIMKIEKLLPKLLTNENVLLIEKLAAGHQYNRTAAISVIGKCGPNKEWGGGSFGVLQSSLLLWTKPLDRCLFFCCHAVGMPTYQAEAAGPIAQFQAEELARELRQDPPRIWVEGPIRWLEGFLERFEDGPYDGDIAPFEDVGEPQPGVDY